MSDQFTLIKPPDKKDYYTIKKSYVKIASLILILLILPSIPSFTADSTSKLIFSVCNTSVYSTDSNLTVFCNSYDNKTGRLTDTRQPLGILNRPVGMVNYYSGVIAYYISNPETYNTSQNNS